MTKCLWFFGRLNWCFRGTNHTLIINDSCRDVKLFYPNYNMFPSLSINTPRGPSKNLLSRKNIYTIEHYFYTSLSVSPYLHRLCTSTNYLTGRGAPDLVTSVSLAPSVTPHCTSHDLRLRLPDRNWKLKRLTSAYSVKGGPESKGETFHSHDSIYWRTKERSRNTVKFSG